MIKLNDFLAELFVIFCKKYNVRGADGKNFKTLGARPLSIFSGKPPPIGIFRDKSCIFLYTNDNMARFNEQDIIKIVTIDIANNVSVCNDKLFSSMRNVFLEEASRLADSKYKHLNISFTKK